MSYRLDFNELAKEFAEKPGHWCRNRRCGEWIEADQPHSFALGLLAGHYCFGCEPAGHQCKTFPET